MENTPVDPFMALTYVWLQDIFFLSNVASEFSNLNSDFPFFTIYICFAGLDKFLLKL